MRIQPLLCGLFVLWVAGIALADDGWDARVIIEALRGFSGVAIGDLDPEVAGNEVAGVNAAGEIWLARRSGDGWSSERIHQTTGELIMCAIGDVDPRLPGNEFVGVGMLEGEESLTGSGQVLMLHRTGGEWKAKRIFEDDRMPHGVAIGDVSHRSPGNEVVICGFNHRVTVLHPTENGWQPEVIYVANDRQKVLTIADILPERDGLEIVVCGSDGRVNVLWEGDHGWHREEVFADAAGQSRVAFGPRGVLIGGDGGKVTLAGRRDGQWTSEFLFRDSAKMRGVAFADTDGDGAKELYACGYSKSVTRLDRGGHSYWSAHTIYQAGAPLHHLIAGDVDPNHPGEELVTCSLSGKVIVLTPH